MKFILEFVRFSTRTLMVATTSRRTTTERTKTVYGPRLPVSTPVAMSTSRLHRKMNNRFRPTVNEPSRMFTRIAPRAPTECDQSQRVYLSISFILLWQVFANHIRKLRGKTGQIHAGTPGNAAAGPPPPAARRNGPSGPGRPLSRGCGPRSFRNCRSAGCTARSGRFSQDPASPRGEVSPPGSPGIPAQSR